MNDFIGKTIGGYQIVELIEDTGSYLIYKGFQPNMNRYVTVNILKSQDPAAVTAFNQQNAILAQFQHPNILPIIDSGSAEGQSYRVLNFMEKGVLRDHLFDFYDLHKASDLLSGVVAGLETIHSQGYVHGNLETGNIYLNETGDPLLTDFGLPKPVGRFPTPFTSPEQVQGGLVDRRADVYGLGVLLYQLVTGEVPSPGVVLSPRSKRLDLPESVEKVILKAIAQNPDARFQNVGEFQDALESAIRPVVPAVTSVSPGVSSKPVGSATPPPPAPKKTNWTAILLGVILVMVVCIGMFWILNWWGGQGEETPVEPTSPPAEIIPTEEPEPTQPPELPSPTAPPEEPPDVENPIETPDDGVNLPEICNSGGFAGGFFVLGGVLIVRKHWRTRSMREKH